MDGVQLNINKGLGTQWRANHFNQAVTGYMEADV
jgi:hypothetical protein